MASGVTRNGFRSGNRTRLRDQGRETETDGDENFHGRNPTFQFAVGPTKIFRPSGHVISRPANCFDPSRASQPFTVTASPNFKVSRAKPVRRSVFGGYPSNAQFSVAPSFFTS